MKSRSSIEVLVSALFLFFVVSLQPHRVHHLFEDSSHSHSGADRGQSRQDPEQAPCIAEAAVKHSHFSPTSVVVLCLTQRHVEDPISSPKIYFSFHSPAPFSQRAPPSA